ncbi:MAG: hypothetical protein K0S97_233 [Chloroflexota bacterium]|jgi:hypothetical protein|nr:hypothetical protein [Chloroflexota bacterium]
MRTDHDDDPAIAAWDAYSAAHKGYAEAHGRLDEQVPQVADDGAEAPAPGRRAEDPALSVAIGRSVDTFGADQPTGPRVRQSDG